MNFTRPIINLKKKRTQLRLLDHKEVTVRDSEIITCNLWRQALNFALA